MYLSKWDPLLEDKRDSPLALVWVSLKHIPFFLTNAQSLFSIVKTLGKPIQMDETTSRGGYLFSARVLVEMDASKPKQPAILVRTPAWDREIHLTYDLPSYCITCGRWGHCCKKSQPVGKVLTGGATLVGANNEHSSPLNYLALLSTVEDIDTPGTPGLKELHYGMPYHIGPLAYIHGSLEEILTASTALTNTKGTAILAITQWRILENAWKLAISFTSILQEDIFLGVGNEAMGSFGADWTIFLATNRCWIGLAVYNSLCLKLRISSIKDDLGLNIEGDSNIASHAIDYYTKIYSEESVSINPELLSYIPKNINEGDNQMLCAVPQEEEIRGAIWDLNSHSAPGPDGYTGTFFKTFWHIVHEEVTRATQEFFLGLPILKSYGATLLTLIPKMDNPKSLGDYRPISLSTFLSKINTKILANRLGALLHKLISPEQSGFQPGKGVEENILLTQEMIHCLDNPSGSANIAIKVDFAKAFDRISWQFLEVTLNSFGFSSQSCHLLLSTLKATHFSILINGSPHGFFKMKRGVKQGDPLSPLLFILGNEGLSRMIKGKVEEGYLKAIQTGRSQPPSHLAYADDIIFFLNGHFINLIRFKGIIDCFLNSSGHMINLNKSHFYTGPRVKPEIKANMQRALQMGEGKLPLNYLGATIGKANAQIYSQHVEQEDAELSMGIQRGKA
ncbi:unnamed protein product [Cuscuta campestris]|uniref:Reverse transcriptase domain-containing protein n=1 Tax=Cuscuta campestris TaxID=132261 RepID=A0A484KZ18_9ASTE|nr:unnamed protein product [Cuscuta campestris]